MRRVAIVSIRGVSNAGGVERVVARHQALLQRDHEVRVFALPERGWMAAARARWGWFERALIVLFPLVASLRGRLWAGRDGLVLSHAYSSIGIGCDAVFAHGCWAEYARAARLPWGLFGPVAYTYEWLAAHLARRVVAVSDTVAAQWQRHYGLTAARTEVAFNGVDTAVFRPADPEARVCAGPRLRVLFVGRLEAAKGLDRLALLHQELEVAGDDVAVCLCSPTTPSGAEARRFPRFEIRSGLDGPTLAAEYNRADLFILPSRYEAFELSSLEALACGTPVLLNPTGSRPTLHRLGCPGVLDLESAPTPLAALRSAAQRFKGLRRGDLGAWTREHFAEDVVTRVLLDQLRGMRPR